MPAIKSRKSVPVDADDLRAVGLLRTEDTYKDALRETTGVELSTTPTEAEAMHALLVAGREAVREKVMLSEYAALAAAQTDEDAQISRAISRRTRRLAD